MSEREDRPGHWKIVHSLDQLGGVLGDITPVLTAFYHQLREEGMSDHAATEMVREVLKHLLTAATKKGRPE